MKKLLCAIAVLGVLLGGACKMDQAVATAKVGMNVAFAGEAAVIAVLQANHQGGTLSDEKWAKIHTFDIRFQALMESARFWLAEYDKLKDKTTGEKFLQLVADLGDIVAAINELIQSWHDPELNKNESILRLRGIPVAADSLKLLL